MKKIFIIHYFPPHARYFSRVRLHKATKQNLGTLDFIPRKDDRIALKLSEQTNAEGVVSCVLYEPLKNVK